MAIRANQLVNFKGEPYATVPLVEEKIQKVSDEVNKIKSEVTDNLLDPTTGNLNAKYNPIKVLSTENKNGLEAVEIKEGEGKDAVVKKYFPDNDYSKIQFIGDCKVTYRNDGQIIIRIGENLNSSNFNTADGQTSGAGGDFVAPSSESDSTTYAPDGTSMGVITSGDYTINTKGGTDAAGYIHFENNTSTKFEVIVTDAGVEKSYYFGPVVGNDIYDAKDAEGNKVSGVTLTVSNFTKETKELEGATGYCGTISFTISAATVAGGDASKISVDKVIHHNGGEGDFEFDCESDSLYYYTDTETKASADGVPTYAISGTTTVTKSGISYYTKGDVLFSATGLTNMYNPVGVADNVVFSTNGWCNSVSGTAGVSDTSKTVTGKLKTCCVSSPTATLTAKNVNGNVATKTSANNFGSGLFVFTGSINANVDEGNGSVGRITSTGGKWTSADKLGATDLQLHQGSIVYPSVNFTGYNGDGVNADRDYSSLGTGDKAYYIKLSFARSTQQPQLTITGTGLNSTNLKAVCVAGSLAVLNNRDALKTLKDGGINDGYVTNTATSKVINLSYLGVGETINTAGAYVKIVMSGTGAEISNIELA